MLPPCSATNVVTAATIPGRSGHDTSSTARDTAVLTRPAVGRRPVCDDGPMIRTAWAAGTRRALGLLTASPRGAATAPPSAPPATVPTGIDRRAAAPFAIPADRLAALDAAGMGWLDIGSAYPAQPAGVPWPTQDWPTGRPGGRRPGRASTWPCSRRSTTPPAAPAASTRCSWCRAATSSSSTTRRATTPTTAHLSWSMAKSITGTMIGMLVDEGKLDPWAPAEVPEWAGADDPRGAITLDDLLHMRSGLEWNEEYSGTSDVIEMLFGSGKDDRAHYAASKPLRGRARLDVVLLDGHVDDPLPHHRRPGRLRRRGHDMGPGQPVRPDRHHHGRARPRRQRRDERRLRTST